MPNPQTTDRHKPSARRGREPARERPSARAPVARGVFGHVPSHPSQLSRPSDPRRRRESSPSPPPREPCLVTGVCGRLGKLLARELHRTDQGGWGRSAPFADRPKDIVHHQVDMRRKKMKDIFRGRNIRAVVHLGVLHDPRRSDRDRHSWNIVAFQKLLDYMSQYEVPKLVVLSGANVYGPQPNNPQFLTEDAPLLGAQHFGGMRDLVELDMLAQSFFWKHPDTETVVLRPCHIVGRVHNAASNYLRLERPVMVMGFDPMMQVVHEKDVVRAIQLALRPGVRGIYNIRGPGRDAAFASDPPGRRAATSGAHAACEGRSRSALEAPAQLVPVTGARPPALRLHGGRLAGSHRVGVRARAFDRPGPQGRPAATPSTELGATELAALAVDAVLPVGALALHPAVALHFAFGVAEVVWSAERDLSVIRGADRIGLGRGDVAFGAAQSLDAEGAVTVRVRAAEGGGRLGRRGWCAACRSPPGRRPRWRRRSPRRSGAGRSPRRSWSRGRGTRCCRCTHRRSADTGCPRRRCRCRADGVWTAKEAAAIVGAGEARRALEVELAGLADRGAQVLDAERVDGAVAIGQAGAVGFGPAAIPKVAFETGRAVSIRAGTRRWRGCNSRRRSARSSSQPGNRRR